MQPDLFLKKTSVYIRFAKDSGGKIDLTEHMLTPVPDAHAVFSSGVGVG